MDDNGTNDNGTNDNGTNDNGTNDNGTNEVAEVDSTIKRIVLILTDDNDDGHETKQTKKGKGRVAAPHKRVEAETWTFCSTLLAHDNQMTLVRSIQQNGYVGNDEMTRLVCQQIKQKLSGYKRQDKTKHIFVPETFVTFSSIVDTMIQNDLLCYYCSQPMDVLYEIAREMSQWSVDRIDNMAGHDVTNYRLSCLECNLRKRRRDDDKFLFTKQFVLTKVE